MTAEQTGSTEIGGQTYNGTVTIAGSLENERGVVIRSVPMNVETGQLELKNFADLLNDKTKLVAKYKGSSTTLPSKKRFTITVVAG